MTGTRPDPTILQKMDKTHKTNKQSNNNPSHIVNKRPTIDQMIMKGAMTEEKRHPI
jgi:hypothetical protein